MAHAPDRINTMIGVSVAFHLGLVGIALIAMNMGSRPRPISEKAIQTKLVRLGQNKPEWLPRKETPPPPPKEEAVAIAADSKAVPVPTPKKAAPTEQKKSFNDLLKRVNDYEKDAKPDDYKGKGDEKGSKAGTEFQTATVGMQYATDIDGRIRPNWDIPTVIPEEERPKLEATVVLYIGPDGKILKSEMAERSGNRLFDDALMRAIRLSSPLPAPPEELKYRVMRDGFEITFRGRPR